MEMDLAPAKTPNFLLEDELGVKTGREYLYCYLTQLSMNNSSNL